MTRPSFILVMTVTALSLLSGCAGLMMSVKDVDEQQARIALRSGDSLSIDEASLESSIAEANPKVDDVVENASATSRRLEAQSICRIPCGAKRCTRTTELPMVRSASNSRRSLVNRPRAYVSR